MNLVISQEDAQALVDYLKLRPWVEVVALVPILTALSPVPVPDEDATKTTEEIFDEEAF